MARGRMISKTLSTSERFALLYQAAGELAEFAQSLYPLIVAHADDFGRQAGDLFTVKHKIHPASPRPVKDFERALAALHNVCLIVWYYDDKKKRCIQVCQFDEHQSGLHKRTKSEFTEPSGPFPEIPGDSLLTELNRTELKGTEEKGTERAKSMCADAHADGFRDFWKRYPKKKAKKDAQKAWGQVKAEAVVPQIHRALDWQTQQRDWTKAKGEYVPLAASWLRGHRWEDEPFNAPDKTQEAW
jgi:hypothetical protein